MAKRIAWTEQAKADLRAIDQKATLRVLHGLARFVTLNEGNVKQLQGIHPPQYRLRLGRYRVRFHDHDDWIEILSVQHRREAYR